MSCLESISLSQRYLLAIPGEFIIHLPKKVHGEWFENLDLLTTLLARRSKRKPPRARTTKEGVDSACESGTSPLIEVLSSAQFEETDEDDDDWEIEQTQPPEVSSAENSFLFSSLCPVYLV